MSTYKLNIPTVISHSNFILDGEVVHILEKELNYFYSLLYLFRENIQKQSDVTIFLKEENKKVINPQFKNFKVKIELLEFDDIGVVNNYTYEELKVFIEILSMIKIRTNILKKNKSYNTQTIDIIESQKIDKDNILYLKFTDEFVNLFLHTEKYFMEVDLSLLFRISGYKAKSLYLTIKDYSNYKNKCIAISKENLNSLIGIIPSKKTFENLIDNLNKTEYMDMNFEYPKDNGKKLKEYKFKYKKLTKNNTSKLIPKKEKINTEVMDEAKKEVQKQKNKGTKIQNEKGYTQTVYNQKIKEINSKKPKEKTETDLKVDEWIQSQILKLKETENLQYQHNNYLVLSIGNAIYFIDDNYTIFEQRDFEKKTPYSKSSEEALRFFDYYNKELMTKIYCSYGEEIKGMTISKIERD